MLNAMALVVLAGMMFIPIINLVVGIVAGGTLFGVVGGVAGAALAALITLAEYAQLPRYEPFSARARSRTTQQRCRAAHRRSDGPVLAA